MCIKKMFLWENNVKSDLIKYAKTTQQKKTHTKNYLKKKIYSFLSQ